MLRLTFRVSNVSDGLLNVYWWLLVVHKPFLFRGHLLDIRYRCYRCTSTASPCLLQIGFARRKRFAMPPWLSKLGNSRRSQIAYHGWHDDDTMILYRCVYFLMCFPLLLVLWRFMYILFGTHIKVAFGCLSAFCAYGSSKGLSIQMLAATLANPQLWDAFLAHDIVVYLPASCPKVNTEKIIIGCCFGKIIGANDSSFLRSSSKATASLNGK